MIEENNNLDNDIPTTPVKKVNPLLRVNKMPGETFRLPSRGIFYKNGELDASVANGEVVVKPMTLLDELYLKTPDMLFQGTAVEEVFKRCIPEILKPQQLFMNDVDYLVLCLRKVTFGDNFEIDYICPKKIQERNKLIQDIKLQRLNDLKEKSKQDNDKELLEQIVKGEYTVDDIAIAETELPKIESKTYTISLSERLKSVRNLDASDLEGRYTLLLESTQQVILLKPTTYKDYITLLQVDAEDFSDIKSYHNFIVDSILCLISSVDGLSDKEMIKEWIESLSASDMQTIIEKMNPSNDWGLNYITEIQCKSCGDTHPAQIPINPINVFTKPSNQKIQN